MNVDWLNLIFGAIAGAILSYLVTTYFGRYTIWRRAKRLIGEWEAFNIEGRALEKMPNAGITVISQTAHWWRRDFNVLTIEARDGETAGNRDHHGRISVSSDDLNAASRVLRYKGSAGVARSHLLVSEDGNEIRVTPLDDSRQDYRPHVLRRREGESTGGCD